MPAVVTFVDGTVLTAADLNTTVTALNQVVGTATTITGYTVGDMLYASGTTALSKLAKGTAGQALVMNSGATAPSWSSAPNVGRPVSVTATATVAIAAADRGTVYIATASSGTQTFTLPTAATAGLVYTFVCGDAAGEILVNPQTGQTISIKATEGGANVTTASGTGIKNTAATNIKNDHITLISDGTTSWYMIAQSGTWASQ